MISPLSKTWLLRLAATFPLLFLASSLHAAEEVDPSVQLREQLRSVLLQLRTAQTDTANAKVAQTAAELKITAAEEEIKKLQAINGQLIKQANDDKAVAEETASNFNTRLEDREKRLVIYQEALEKWKAGYEKAAAVARSKEEERAALADQAIIDKRDIADLRRKNIALFNCSNEILDRYEGYSLGKALSAREPFIGTTRVKLENLVQGYKGKILDNRIAAPAKP
jgi:hypothetical protein